MVLPRLSGMEQSKQVIKLISGRKTLENLNFPQCFEWNIIGLKNLVTNNSNFLAVPAFFIAKSTVFHCFMGKISDSVEDFNRIAVGCEELDSEEVNVVTASAFPCASGSGTGSLTSFLRLKLCRPSFYLHN